MRLVVKVGTSTLMHQAGRLNIRRVETLCKVLSDLRNAGHEIILVSSGSIGMGTGKLSLKERPADIPTRQAAAAVGQCELMYVYDREFSTYNHIIAQILITYEDIRNKANFTNFHNTLTKLLEMGAIPIINENDTVATEEINIGDNDTLSAIVATSIKADLLVLLSDIDGLFDSNPKKNPDAKIIHEVKEITEDIISMGGEKGSDLGTGGMATKLSAAKTATSEGIDMVIANGADPDILYDIVEGKKVGTRFYGKVN